MLVKTENKCLKLEVRCLFVLLGMKKINHTNTSNWLQMNESITVDRQMVYMLVQWKLDPLLDTHTLHQSIDSVQNNLANNTIF